MNVWTQVHVDTSSMEHLLVDNTGHLFQLTVQICENCNLVQLNKVV